MPYFSELDSETVIITAEQGSRFAKQVATDFNPIHDVDSKRFCVPGDLLFAIALHKYGLHQRMHFEFNNLVAADSHLSYPPMQNSEVSVCYAPRADGGSASKVGKPVLTLNATGAQTDNSVSIEALIRRYVAFSGQNFQHILLPLMKRYEVMINPARPLVIYQSMSFDLSKHRFIDDGFADLTIDMTNSRLDVQGKRGIAVLDFEFSDESGKLGNGAKHLVLSGLRPYDEGVMRDLLDDYVASTNVTPD